MLNQNLKGIFAFFVYTYEMHGLAYHLQYKENNYYA